MMKCFCVYLCYTPIGVFIASIPFHLNSVRTWFWIYLDSLFAFIRHLFPLHLMLNSMREAINDCMLNLFSLPFMHLIRNRYATSNPRCSTQTVSLNARWVTKPKRNHNMILTMFHLKLTFLIYRNHWLIPCLCSMWTLPLLFQYIQRMRQPPSIISSIFRLICT